jgi:hypothetical protein
VSFSTPPYTAYEPIFSPKAAQLDTPGTQWSSSDKSSTSESFQSCPSDEPPALSEASEEAKTEYLDDELTPPIDLRSQADINLIKSLGRRELLPIPCLQCVLSNLPCDYKMPHCSRCLRKDTPCLAQRPCFHDEKECLGIGLISGFKLLRLWETDEEWKDKMVLEEKLMNELQGKIERANWVVPSVMSVRGGFRSQFVWRGPVVLAMKRLVFVLINHLTILKIIS